MALAAELGMPCPQGPCPPGLNEHQKRILAADLNVARRHLTDGQKVLLGRQIEDDIAAEGRRRMAEAGAKASPGKPGTNGPPLEVQRTRDEVAAKVKLGSGRKYDRAKKDLAKVEEHAPEYLPALETGAVDLRDVRREIRRREKREKVAEISSRDVPEQTGAYTVIYADPPGGTNTPRPPHGA